MDKITELKKTLNSIMNCMKADYPEDFSKIIHDRESAEEYRDLLIKALNGFSSQTIVDGYDKAAESSPNKMPSVSDIARGCVSEYTNKPKQAKEPAKKDADTPKKELTTDIAHPLQLLSYALKNHSIPENETEEEKKDRKAKIIKDHSGLITDYQRKGIIRKNPYSQEHNCNGIGCFNAGTLSSGVVGGGRFYCPSCKIKVA